MFGALLEKDFVPTLEGRALPAIQKDRNIYKPIRNTVLQFCKENPVYVSNPDALVGKKEESETFSIYCDNPYKYCTKLTNLLYKNHTKYIVMNTLAKHEMMEIFINARKVVSMYIIKPEKNINVSDLILPVKIKDVNYISPELELISLYGDLYNPSKAAEWENLLKLEEPLLKQVYDRIGILGGKCTDCKVKRTNDINTLKQLIFTHFIPKKMYVLLGIWALDVYNSKESKSTEKIQVISKRSIEDDLQDLIDFLGQYTDFAVTYRKKNIMIHKDFRMHKFIIYIRYPKLGKTTQKPIMDIYNNAQFELIPYIEKSGYMLANIFVLSRFIMIDLWVIRIIHKMNLIQKEFLKTKIRNLFDLMKQIKKIDSVIFGTQYLGEFQDYSIAKKLEMMEKNFSLPYYPSVEDKSKGLREI